MLNIYFMAEIALGTIFKLYSIFHVLSESPDGE